ncbi:hypothetical protein [Methanosarcina barkeri]|nr:hypothetical protein [Methanosarcina barkeri]
MPGKSLENLIKYAVIPEFRELAGLKMKFGFSGFTDFSCNVPKV